MKALYDHKLFVTSSRKSSIIASMNDPSNARLVMQLSSYLDPQYRKAEYLERQDEEEDYIDLEDDFEVPEEQPEQDDSGFDQPSFSTPPAGPSYDLEDLPDNSDTVDDAPETDMPEGDNPDVQDEMKGEISESEDIVVDSPVLDTAKLIRDYLNSDELTSGVNRVIKKNSELWIYYNDDINLNKIMGTVVELVESKLGSGATFNRLARSDNAIVFEVDDEIL